MILLLLEGTFLVGARLRCHFEIKVLGLLLHNWVKVRPRVLRANTMRLCSLRDAHTLHRAQQVFLLGKAHDLHAAILQRRAGADRHGIEAFARYGSSDKPAPVIHRKNLHLHENDVLSGSGHNQHLQLVNCCYCRREIAQARQRRPKGWVLKSQPSLPDAAARLTHRRLRSSLPSSS